MQGTTKLNNRDSSTAFAEKVRRVIQQDSGLRFLDGTWNMTTGFPAVATTVHVEFPLTKDGTTPSPFYIARDVDYTEGGGTRTSDSITAKSLRVKGRFEYTDSYATADTYDQRDDPWAVRSEIAPTTIRGYYALIKYKADTEVEWTDLNLSLTDDYMHSYPPYNFLTTGDGTEYFQFERPYKIIKIKPMVFHIREEDVKVRWNTGGTAGYWEANLKKEFPVEFTIHFNERLRYLDEVQTDFETWSLPTGLDCQRYGMVYWFEQQDAGTTTWGNVDTTNFAFYSNFRFYYYNGLN